jgi:subtilisin family serine protease
MRRTSTLLLVCLFFTMPLMARTTKLHGTPPEKLIEEAKKKGSVSVFVGFTLAEEWKPEGKLDKAKGAKQRDDIAKAQEKLLRKLKLDKGKVTLFRTIPHMQIDADAALIAKLADDDDVVRIDEEQVMTISLADTIPQINADDAWNWNGTNNGYTGAGRIVAQLDTGVEKTHPAFAGKIQSADEACFSRNGTGNSIVKSTCGGTAPGLDQSTGVDGASKPCDVALSVDCFHGTVTAGVAVSGNSTYAGVAKGASLMPVQVMTYPAPAPDARMVSYEADHVRALQWIESRVDAGRPVAAVNVSLATTEVVGSTGSPNQCETRNDQTQAASMPTYMAAVESLRSKGVAVVAGTGNSGRKDAVAFPACLANVISVAAVGKDDVVGTYSNRYGPWVDMWAPGGTDAGRITAPTLGGTYASISGPFTAGGQSKAHFGTSLATPHVAGAIAILREKFPNATQADLENAVKTTGPLVSISDTIGETVVTVTKHRLDVRAAIEALGGDVEVPSTPAGVNAKVTSSETSMTVTWSASTDNVGVHHYLVQRRSTINGAWEPVGGEITGLSVADDGRTSGAVYRYRVSAVDAAGNQSAWSAEDMGLAMFFSEEPLSVPGSPVKLKGRHIAELRKAIDGWRVYAGLSRQWAPPYPDVTGAITAANLQDMYGSSGGQLRGIDAARSALGLPAFSYSGTHVAPASNGFAYASHVQELRAILQ